MTVYYLENDHIRIGVTKSGIIASIYNKKTGTEFIEKDKGSGWKLVTSLRGWTEYPVFDYMNAGTIKKNGDSIEIFFKHLTGLEGDRLAVSMNLYFRLRGEDVVLEVAIKNNSKETVREVWFPLISGLDKISSSKIEPSLTVPFWAGSKFEDPARTLSENWIPLEGHLSWKFPVLYPGIASMSWLDFYNDKEGLYLASYDTTFQTTGLAARRRKEKGDFQIGIIKYPFAGPQESWRSKEFIISGHTGDWHAAARKYRKFADIWMEKIRRAAWIEDAPGICDLFMKHQNKRIYFNYDRLPRIQKENADRGVNLPLYIFSWYKNGHDSGYPEYAPDKDMGGEKKLRVALKDVRKKGGRSILYTQGRLIDFSTGYYKRKGHKACIKNEDGIFYVDKYAWPIQGTISPQKIFAIACPSTEEWPKQLNRQADMVMALGADGLLFDQMGGDHPYLCFDKSHLHKKPAMAFAGKIKLLKDLQGRVKAKDRDFAVMVELVCDCFTQYADMVHSHNDSFVVQGNMLPLPELYRYTFPEHIITSRDAQKKETINHSFVLGLRQEYWRMAEPFEHVDRRFENDPEQLRVKDYRGKMLGAKTYLEKIFRLKKKYPALLISGVFRDTDGIKILNKDVEAKLFLAKDRKQKAVILWNRSEKRQEIKLEIGRTVTRYKISYLDRETSKEAPNLSDPLNVPLPAGDICVVIVQ